MDRSAPCRVVAAAFALITLSMLVPSGVAAATFTDVPERDALYEAVEYLADRDIIGGFTDGTFRPSQKVQRAEAVKLIVTSMGDEVGKPTGKYDSPFTDVDSDAWFTPYVEYARKELQIVDGPPKASSFHPEKAVKKTEFLKMLLLAHGFEPAMFSEIKLPLSSDSVNTDAWDYPYIRLAVATSTLIPNKNGLLTPQKELTRGDVALLLYRFLLYRDGNRTQALLTEVEQELLATTDALNARDMKSAGYASARALLAARGAKEAAPDQAIVAAVVRITEAYRALVRATQASVDKRTEEAVRLSKDAWFIASQAMKLSDTVKTFATEVQKSAGKIAAEARKNG